MMAFAHILLSLGLVGFGQQPTPAVENGTFDSNGVKIHYTVQGKGEPVLLIHGFIGSIPTQWDLPGVTRALTDHYRVIALDNRGHGLSGKPHDAKKYGVEMSEDAVRLLDHLKVDKAHVVGYSMGAMIAGNLMVRHPERLLSVTLGGAGVLRKGVPTAFFDSLAESLEKEKSIAPLIEFLTPAGQAKPTPQQMKTNNTLIGLTNDFAALAAVVRSWKDMAVSDEQLKANKVPVEGIVGDRDPLKQPLDELKGVLAGLEIVVVPGGDHMNTFAKPEFTQALRSFLGKNAVKK
jgi:pimeloyl-ACP methyl ester carboxylesterase